MNPTLALVGDDLLRLTRARDAIPISLPHTRHTMRPITACLALAALLAACDSATESVNPSSNDPSTLALAAGGALVDPSTLIPEPPPGAVCRADGQWIICHTSLSFAPLNEPGFELPCGLFYETGTDERRGIRWYTSDRLLARRFVSQDAETTWSLSPTGAGPFVTLIAHANWRNAYAVPGDESTGPQITHGNEVTLKQQGGGVIAHIAGLDLSEFTHHGALRWVDDPAVAASVCTALAL
jgi:hypothetical protein